MTDRLVALANHPWAAPVVRALGLPAPKLLKRRNGAFASRELDGRAVRVLPLANGMLVSAMGETLAHLGAATRDAGRCDTIVVDATGCARTPSLDALYAGVQAALQDLAPGGRVLLLAARTAASPEAAACARAVEGLTRSLAKELGRRGATANALSLDADARHALAAPLAFFCGDRSAFVSGQVLRVDASQAASPPQTRVFEGRTAVVTGAAGGIGAATVRRLAADGAFVLCLDVPSTQAALQGLADEAGGRAVVTDLTSGDAPRQLMEALADRGGVDLLVHNAGVTRDRTLARMTPAEWGAVLDVNLRAVLAIDRTLDAAGALRPGAREVCLSSISGIAGNAGQANYAAAKAALIAYAAARGRELAPRAITVNAVAPGFIETSMTHGIPLLVREAGRRLNSLMQGGRPEDVAEAIAFLARPDAGGVNGQVLRVCGQSFLGA